MKITTILIAGVLPLALFAKDDDMAGKIVPRLVDSKSTELNQTIDGIDDFAPEAEAQTVGKFVINESNFTQKKSKTRKAKATSKAAKAETLAKQDMTSDSATSDLGTEEGINSDSLDTEEAPPKSFLSSTCRLPSSRRKVVALQAITVRVSTACIAV